MAESAFKWLSGAHAPTGPPQTEHPQQGLVDVRSKDADPIAGRESARVQSGGQLPRVAAGFGIGDVAFIGNDEGPVAVVPSALVEVVDDPHVDTFLGSWS